LIVQIVLFLGLVVRHRKKVGPGSFDLSHKKWALITGLSVLLVMVSLSPRGFYGGIEMIADKSARVLDHATLWRGGDIRFAIWPNSLMMIKEHGLLGVGIGNWMVQYSLYQQAVLADWEMTDKIQHLNAHNDYVEITAELGLVGLVLGLWLIGSVLRQAFRVIDDERSRDPALMIGLIVSLIGIGVNAFFSFPFKQPVPVFLSMIYLGVLCAQCHMGAEAPGGAVARPFLRLPGRWCSTVATVLFLVLTFLVLGIQERWYRAEVHFRKAMISMQAEDYQTMLLEGQRAHDFNPWRDRLLNFVGMGYFHTGRKGQAIDVLEQVMESYPYHFMTLENLADAYASIGEYEKAVERLELLVRLRPNDQEAHRKLASILADHFGQKEKGHEHLIRP